MNKAAFHSAGRLDIDMFVNRFRVQRFVFLAEGLAFDISGFTWQLFIKTNPGDLRNIISLTLGNGLSFPIYEENVIEARFESATTNIQEGDYYWQLLRTDTNEPWLNGIAKFSFGSLDSGGTSQEGTVNLLNNEITVSLQSIVNVSGGSSALIEFGDHDASKDTFPDGVSYRFYKITLGGTLNGVPVNPGDVLIKMQETPTADWNPLTGWKRI